MMSRATQSKLLDQRIAENSSAQQVDLGSWIFERLRVESDAKVLELCCGTGGQTLSFLQRAREIVAVDISPDALNKLAAKVKPDFAKKLTLVESNLNEFGDRLLQANAKQASFDLVFCAYGLYYGTDTAQILNESRRWLKKSGRIVVVGPFGPNNHQLFDIVRASGIVISDAVVSSSERFMLNAVVPWGSINLEEIRISTMVNQVRWTDSERVLSYWENTTFYDPEKRTVFEDRLRRHFEKSGEFVNEKWVMMVEMANARS